MPTEENKIEQGHLFINTKEEITNWFKDNIKCYEKAIIECSSYEFLREKKIIEEKLKAFKATLNYIEHSIHREVVEDAIRNEKEEIKYAKNNNNKVKRHAYTLNVLQEILEVQE